MNGWRIVTVLLLCLVLVGTVACNPFGNSKEANQQLVEVMRGDLTVTVNSIGNIVIPEERMLSFSSSGRVEKIYIKEGDEVSKGDALAKLNTDALDLALTQAQVALIKQQVASVEQQVAVTQAQLALETAKYNMYEAQDLYLLSDIKVAQADVAEAERYLDESLWNLSQYSSGSEGEKSWQQSVVHAQSRLNAAKGRLEAMLAGSDSQEIVIKRLEIELAQQSLELAQQSQEEARQSIEEAQRSLVRSPE